MNVIMLWNLDKIQIFMKDKLFMIIAITVLASCQTKDHKALIQQLTPEQKVRLLIGSGQGSDGEDKSQQMMAAAMNAVPGSAAASYPIEEFNIPSIIYADGPAGLRIAPRREGTDSTFFCTGFPIGESLSATWNTQLQEEVGKAMGNEVLEYGVDVLLAPGMNLMRNPLCGRNFEYYSEDPLLSGRTAASMVRGIQSNGVGCSIKHFAANNQEVNRCSSDSRVGARTLRELYLRNFEIAVKEGKPWTIMTSYNYVNGQHASQSRELTEDILRGDWGYEGLVMTDWGAGTNAAAQVGAGNDNIMPGSGASYDVIMNAINEGTLTWEEVERNLERMLSLIDKTPKSRSYQYSNHPDLKAHAVVARLAGAEGCVLLKNHEALPCGQGDKIALFGVTSYETIPGGTGAGDVNKAYVINIDEGLTEVGFTLNKQVTDAYAAHIASENERLAEINEERGWWFGAQLKDEMPTSVTTELSSQVAQECDAAFITIGRRSGEGNDRALEGDYNLNEEELTLISNVSNSFHACGKRVTVILNVCGPVKTNDWEEMVDAILVAWQPGQEAGRSIADVLCGNVCPSGKLPMTFARNYEDHPSSKNFANLNLGFDGKNNSFYHYSDHPIYEIKDVDYQDYDEKLAVGYRYFSTSGTPVSYPFGFGLSYTQFAFQDFSVERKGDEIKMHVKVTNNGDCAGKEVVQIYWSNPSIPDEPRCQLLSYGKTELLQPGESCQMTLTAKQDDLSWFNEEESAWRTETSEYTIELRSDANTLIDSRPLKFKKTLVRPCARVLLPNL